MSDFRALFWAGVLVVLTTYAAFGADIPDPNFTPGAIDRNVKDVCKVKWGTDARHVTLSMKKEVFADYDIPWSEHAKYEVDHLISRELGGADSTNNLWPQLWVGKWNAHMKDKLENRLHKEVCAGRMALDFAQYLIAHDWRIAYVRYYGEP